MRHPTVVVYAEDYRVQKKDIDSFFTASGKASLSRRIIVSTTNNWSEHAEDTLQGQQPAVTKIDLQALKESQIDWAKYQPNHTVTLKAKKELRDHQKTAVNAVERGLLSADRGKLIMACGTGKTFTSLKLPNSWRAKASAFFSQTLAEWVIENASRMDAARATYVKHRNINERKRI